jgi:nucleoside-diphosphate-sugar epimerase
VRVFLTGGTGLVGSHVAERLRERGHDVVALVRPSVDAAFLASVGAEPVEGDVTAVSAELAARMAGCDAVVHAAARVYRRAPWAMYHQLNVAATERVLRAAAAAGAGRVLHVSSVAVYGIGGSGARITEDAWRERPIPPHATYARSKREAEEVAWRLHAEGAIRLTTVRPVVVYGERDRLFTPILARVVRFPVVPLPGGGRAAVPVAYAGNVADAIVDALELPVAVGRAYNLVEERTISARRLLRIFARELGKAPRLWTVPAGLALGPATVIDGLARVLPGLRGAELRRGVRLLSRGNPYDAARARQDLGWTGRVEHEQAVARTAAWWRRTNR